MKRITITVINDLYTDQRVHRMAGSLVKEGFEVVLVGRKLRNSQELKDFQFQYRRFKMLFTKGPFFYLFYNFRLFIYLLFFKKPNLFIAVDLDTLLANYIVSRIRKVPLLYDSHEYFTEVPELINRPRIKKIWERIEAGILPRLNHAIAVSDTISKIYTEKYSIKFETIRNVSKRRLSIPYPEFGEIYTTKFKIIYQGSLNPGRGIELMIEAMKWLDDCILFIVGDGDLAEELRGLSHKFDLDEHIVFTGRIEPDELHKLTGQCDLGLSLEEDLGMNYRFALPNKIFDYIQAGIPVLCSNLPEMARIVNSYAVGEVCKNRMPMEVAQQIGRMLEDKEMKLTWQKNIDMAAAELCWEKEEIKLLRIVETIIEG